LIDDIQFISEKEKTIEEVFNTYNTLYASRKQMVFTSDKPPKEILGLDERLIGRLASGLLVDIQPPSYEIKVAILKNKASLDGVKQDGGPGLSEVIAFIAENIKSNVRELESAFNRVVAYAKFVGVPFSKALAKQVLSDILKASATELSPKDIKKVVANYYNISVSAIDSEDRTRSLSVPRQIAMYLCREITHIPFPKIAEIFKKDCSTVQHACKKIKTDIKKDEALKTIVDELTEKLRTEY
jgi:chromosomal replication initiator protein